MIAYVLSDGAGNYIRLKKDGKYDTVTDTKLALQFQTAGKAKNYLGNSFPAKMRDEFRVERVLINEIRTTKDKKVLESMIRPENMDDEIASWMDQVDDLIGFVKSIEARILELEDLISCADQEICDVQHYIEFGTFNAYQGYLATRLLQSKLRQRRKYKDEFATLNQIKSCKIDVNSIMNLYTVIEGLNDRKYTPRVLWELFGNENEE